jgi:hypothetical protein
MISRHRNYVKMQDKAPNLENVLSIFEYYIATFFFANLTLEY